MHECNWTKSRHVTCNPVVYWCHHVNSNDNRNCRPCGLCTQEKCHQYWPSERSARYQYYVVDPMAEYNMPQYILREFKITDARVINSSSSLNSPLLLVTLKPTKAFKAFVITSPTEGDGSLCFRRRRYVDRYLGIYKYIGIFLLCL